MITTLGPAKSWRLIHNGEAVLMLAEASGITETIYSAFESLTQAGCVAEARRLFLNVPEDLAEVFALHTDPLPSPLFKQFTSLEYLDLFTEPEQLSVVSATMASPQVKLWYDKMLAAGFITSADPRTEGGLSALVGAGLLTEARKVAILGAMA